MNLIQRFTEWLNIRPGEGRVVSLSLVGAFLFMGFSILARSLRETLYLSAFDVKALPYIIAAVAFLSLPVVGAFTAMLARYSPARVIRGLIGILVVGLGLLWPFATHSGVATIVFYLWTSLGTLLLGSGFWVMTSEIFPVRGAKRVFGIISAGGTAGALVTGISLRSLTRLVELTWLIPMLIGLLLLFFLVQFFLPRQDERRDSGHEQEEASQSSRENLKLITGSRHLKIIASIVFIATMAGTLVDYQFKDFARGTYDADADLAGFFGAFYGWTGGIALFVQLVLASRLMSAFGVSGVLSTLGLINVLGAFGVMLVPGLASVTVLRGANNSFRSSLYRPTLEFLFVPIPAELRRKTKSFIDTVVDSGGEGAGAAIVFFLVTLGGIQSRYLGLAVVVLAGVFIVLSRRMGSQYFDTIVQRLKVGEEEREKSGDDPRRGLLSATFSRIELQSVMIDAGMLSASRDPRSPSKPLETQDEQVRRSALPLEERLKSADNRVVEKALEEIEEWDDATVATVVRLLARDALLDKVVSKVTAHSEACLPRLIECLRDENTDFVIRRRIPRAMDRIDSVEVVEVLLDALTANRFEVRYRSVIALARKQRRGVEWSRRNWKELVWQAIRSEVGRGRPVWELQKLLDGFDSGTDDLVEERVGARGELSLEHTFRLLSLVLDPKPVRASFHGILYGDQGLISFALEYLEQVLPSDVRKRLWLLIGDMSEYQKSRAIRPLDKVVEELVGTHATLFAGDLERDALKKMLEDRTEKESGPVH